MVGILEANRTLHVVTGCAVIIITEVGSSRGGTRLETPFVK